MKSLRWLGGSVFMSLISAPLKIAVLALLLVTCKESSFDCNGKLKGASPLNIRNCIVGTWTMTGSSGGFSGQGMGDVSGRQIKFTLTDSIYYFYRGQKVVGDKIVWLKGKDVVGEDNYLMLFHDKYGYPYDWGVEGIHDGRLIVYENANDGFTYYFKRD